MIKILRILSYPLMILGIVVVAPEFWAALKVFFVSLGVFKWFFIGMGAFFALRIIPFLGRNSRVLETASHEITHMVLCLLFFKQVKSMKISSEGSGEVWHSGNGIGNTFIALAPYTLPLFTFIILIFSIWGSAESMHVFHLLIGFSLAFHLVCFATQTSLRQTDITSQGVVRSFLYIALFLMFNLAIVLLSVKNGFTDAIVSVCKGMVENFLEIFSSLKS